MRFDINDYAGKHVMHCKTEEEAKEFIMTLMANRLEVNEENCEFLVDCLYNLRDWNEFKKQTCYWYDKSYDCIVRCDYNWYKNEGYTILEWSDFKANEFTKADLKDGMVVEYANGWKRMVFNGKLLGMSGNASLREFADDLKSLLNQGININKVYTCNTDCILNLTEIFDDNNLTLIWERKEKPEPVEMTLEEVCKALGKEIKIVKG